MTNVEASSGISQLSVAEVKKAQSHHLEKYIRKNKIETVLASVSVAILGVAATWSATRPNGAIPAGIEGLGTVIPLYYAFLTSEKGTRAKDELKKVKESL